MTRIYTVRESSLTTRRAIANLVEEVLEAGYDVIDLSEVEFISRSVADELVFQSEVRDIKLQGLSGDVKKMIAAVDGTKATAE